MRAPSLFLKLINKISLSAKTRTLVRVTAKCVCVCLVINHCLIVVWQRSGARAGDEPAFHRVSLHASHLGEVHPLLSNPGLMTFDPAPQFLNSLDLDQTTNEPPYPPHVLFSAVTTNTQIGFFCTRSSSASDSGDHLVAPSHHCVHVSHMMGWMERSGVAVPFKQQE